MTKTQWKTQRTMPYVGYTLGRNIFSWEFVERIGEITINKSTLATQFIVYFTSGNNYVYSYPKYTLTPDYETRVNLFGMKSKTEITNVQYYFERNCSKLQAVSKIREKAVRAFLQHKRSQAKHKHI